MKSLSADSLSKQLSDPGVSIEEISQALYKRFSNKTNLQKNIEQLTMLIQVMAVMKKDGQHERIVALKQALAKNSRSWKEALLGISSQELQKQKQIKLSAALTLQKTLQPRERFLEGNNATQDSASLTGSTYCNVSESEKLQEIMNLDGGFSRFLQDAKGLFKGYALAIADGYGHHTETYQNINTARTAYYAAKYSTLLLALLQDKIDSNDLLLLLRYSGQQAFIKGNSQTWEKFKSSTTVVRAIARTADEYLVDAATVGDSLAFAWIPQQKRFVQLSVARIYYNKLYNGWYPISVTEFSDEVQVEQLMLPTETILFVVTDGLWDELPHQKIEKTDGQQRRYRDVILDSDAMSDLLTNVDEQAGVASVSVYNNYLTQYILERINQQRADLLVQCEKLQLALADERFQPLYQYTVQDLRNYFIEQTDNQAEQALLDYIKHQGFTMIAPLEFLKKELSRTSLGDDVMIIGQRLMQPSVEYLRPLLQEKSSDRDYARQIAKKLKYINVQPYFDYLGEEKLNGQLRYSSNQLEQAKKILALASRKNNLGIFNSIYNCIERTVAGPFKPTSQASKENERQFTF